MGRDLKRVPLDFEWPDNEIWKGYVNPFYEHASKCHACGGSGYSPEATRIKDLWYGYREFHPEDRGSVPFLPTDNAIMRLAERNVGRTPEYYGTGNKAVAMEAKRLASLFNGSMSHHLNQDDVDMLAAKGRLYDFTHTWTRGEGWKEKDPPYCPTAKEVNEWSISGMGHDSSNCYYVIEAECKRLGHSTECEYCKGEGQIWSPAEMKKKADDWKPEEPPVGDGFQLWETTSEGSPISPVFDSLEKLCEWAAENASTFGSNKAAKEDWMSMLNDGLVCHKEGNAIFI